MLFTTKLQETKDLSSFYNLVMNESIQSKADMLNQKDDILVTHWIWLRRKVWPRTWVNSLKVHGWYREKLEDRKSFHLENEMDISFGHLKVLYGTFDKNMRIVTFRCFDWRFNMERKAVANGLCFWNYFGGALLWVLLSVFHFHCFSTFGCLPTRSPL